MVMKAMTVAGVMSGTSADGIDVAVVRIVAGKGETGIARPKLTLLAHKGFAFPAALRKAVLAAMNARSASTAELARLNWRLGIAYADAVESTIKSQKKKLGPAGLDLIGCHGQTLFHQARRAAYAGKRLACTWQAGEPALIAARLGVPVVSNFRPADMAAGGQGAPLVSLWTRFTEHWRHRQLNRHSRSSNSRASDRVRYWPRQHGDRCIGPAVVWKTI
jgi:anhydro-N-acetylmuramic acid kinase